MAESLTGRLQGNTITLDAPVPLLEGQLVKVLVEPLDDPEAQISPTAQAALWQEWVLRGPQGPLEEGDADGLEP
jgi:hypothetical protein